MTELILEIFKQFLSKNKEALKLILSSLE